MAIGRRLEDQRARDVDKLAASTAGATGGGEAIIRRLDLELEEEVARRHPNLTTHRGRARWVRSMSGFEAGQAAGQRMSLRSASGHLG